MTGRTSWQSAILIDGPRGNGLDANVAFNLFGTMKPIGHARITLRLPFGLHGIQAISLGHSLWS